MRNRLTARMIVVLCIYLLVVSVTEVIASTLSIFAVPTVVTYISNGEYIDIGLEPEIFEVEKEMIEEPVVITSISNTEHVLYYYNGIDHERGIVPDNTSSFMAWMDYRTIKSYRQYELQQDENIWIDENGLQRYDDYYVVAVGTHYADNVGDILEIRLDNGSVFTAIVGDFKADCHTDATNRMNPWNNSVLEFIVDTPTLHKEVKRDGTVSSLPFFDSTVHDMKIIGSKIWEV